MIGLPCPSQRRWILVLKPPWLRPRASSAGVLFLPLRHADERGRCCRPRNGFPNPIRPVDRPSIGVRPTRDPKSPPVSIVESGCKHCSTTQIALASRARVHRFAKSTTSHSPLSGDLCWVALFWAFGAAKAVLTAPIVHSLSHLGSWRPIIQNRFLLCKHALVQVGYTFTIIPYIRYAQRPVELLISGFRVQVPGE